MGKLKVKKPATCELNGRSSSSTSTTTTTAKPMMSAASKLAVVGQIGATGAFPLIERKAQTETTTVKAATGESTQKQQQKLNKSGAARKTSRVIGKVQFKATDKLRGSENKSVFKKLKAAKLSTTNKSQYEAIKTNFLKQIRDTVLDTESVSSSTAAAAAASASFSAVKGSGGDEPAVNFVIKKQQHRLTNTLIKSLLSSDSGAVAAAASKSGGSTSTKAVKPSSLSRGGIQKLSKKSKTKLKQQVWEKRIDLIKNKLKDKADRLRREKTAIVGDVRPIIDSLMSTVSKLKPIAAAATSATGDLSQTSVFAAAVADAAAGSSASGGMSRKERREQNVARELSKEIPKQSVRFKKSQQDRDLFGQLIGYSEFTNNPLETLRKHL